MLLILVGSDLSMMEALTSYGRPFHQRGTQLKVGPPNPADVAAMAGLSAAGAFDAALVTGGLPIICARWRHGEDTRSFLARELANPVSPLVVSAQLSLAAEFPDQAQARMVLAAIGSGERTFTNIARAAGGIAHSTLTRAADLLISKGVVAGELPVSLSPSKERRYRITDSYLRFWLAFLGPHLAEAGPSALGPDAGPDRAELESHWRGRAVEPLVREALARLLPAQDIPGAPVIGGYWTRSNDVEIGIVGADREPIARQLLFLGSVKWLETGQFDAHDLLALQRHRDRVTADPVPAHRCLPLRNIHHARRRRLHPSRPGSGLVTDGQDPRRPAPRQAPETPTGGPGSTARTRSGISSASCATISHRRPRNAGTDPLCQRLDTARAEITRLRVRTAPSATSSPATSASSEHSTP